MAVCKASRSGRGTHTELQLSALGFSLLLLCCGKRLVVSPVSVPVRARASAPSAPYSTMVWCPVRVSVAVEHHAPSSRLIRCASRGVALPSAGLAAFKMPPAADYLILKRRAQEEERMTYDRLTKSNFKAAANAEWEIKTQGFIDHTKATQRFNAIRAADDAALNARRQRLANMLADEQAMFQQQLEDLTESPAQRKARMEARAAELKDKREGERLAFVRQQYERQWVQI